MFPRLYPILDAGLLAQRNISIAQFTHELSQAGIELLQYRDKDASPQTILQNAAIIREAVGPKIKLILNDRPDLALLADYDGVHVGQTDLAPNDARTVIGKGRIIGVSTHNIAQFEAAIATEADYIAIGPIYATTTKQNPDPTTGLDLLKQARKLTSKPIVAIGGISSRTAREVLDAGADSIAVISALIPTGNCGSATPFAESFLKLLG